MGTRALENRLSRLFVYICVSIVICNNNNQGKEIHKSERELGAWERWEGGDIVRARREKVM